MTNEKEKHREVKPLDILVVEDKPNHLIDVKNKMRRRIEAGIPIRVDYATNLSEALTYLENPYDGVISDIFFPEGDEWVNHYDLLRILNSVIELPGKHSKLSDHYDVSWKEEAPLGLLVAENAREKLIPTVFCSDMNHHGRKVEPINKYSRTILHTEITDNGSDLYSDAKVKDWDSAFVNLLKEKAEINCITFDEGCIPQWRGSRTRQENVPKYFESVRPYLLEEEIQSFETPSGN